MAAYKSEYELPRLTMLPTLEQMEAGKPIGAVLPMSEKAQHRLRDRIEIIEYLLNHDDVTWN